MGAFYPAFASLLPRPPAENPTQALQAGELGGLRTMLGQQDVLGAQQQYQQRAALAPIVQQQQEATATEAQARAQQQQQALTDQQAISRAWRENDGDMDAVPAAATQYGASAAAIEKFNTDRVAHQQQLQQLDSTTLANNNQRVMQFVPRGKAFVQEDDDYKQDHWGDFLDGLTRDGIMTPAEHAATIEQMPAYPGDDQFNLLIAGHYSLAQQGEAALVQQRQAAAARNTAQAKKLNAEAPGSAATADQQVRANYASQLAAATDNDSYQAILGEIPQKYAGQLPQEYDPDTTPATLRAWGSTPAQAATAAGAAQRNATTAAHNAVTEKQGAQRVGIEQQRLNIEQGRASNFGGLTANEWQNQANALNAEEHGSGMNNQGLQAQRAYYRTVLAQPYSLNPNGSRIFDKQGNPVWMGAAQKQLIQSRLDGVTSRLQILQSRKAQLQGLGVPQAQPDSVAEGGNAFASDGAIWRKQDGILYPTGNKAMLPTARQLQAIPEGGNGKMPDGHVWERQNGIVHLVQ